MKTLILAFSLLIVSSMAFGQRKSKKEAETADNSKVLADSLTKANKSLSLQLDSVSGELLKYKGVYNAVREKVIHYFFDPARSSYLIDSLKASRDSLFSLQVSKPLLTASADSVDMLLKSNSVLKSKIDSLKLAWEKEAVAVPKEDIDKSNAISSLKQLKELLDAKIITEAEYIALKKKYLSKL